MESNVVIGVIAMAVCVFVVHGEPMPFDEALTLLNGRCLHEYGGELQLVNVA